MEIVFVYNKCCEGIVYITIERFSSAHALTWLVKMAELTEMAHV